MTDNLALILCRKCEQYFNQPLGEARCAVCDGPVQLIDARTKSVREGERVAAELYRFAVKQLED